MNATERQKELARWFEMLELFVGWKGGRLHPDGSVTSTNPYCIGPWLDADWCFEFMTRLHKETVDFNFGVDSDGEVEVENLEFLEDNGHICETFKNVSLTEGVQEAVRQAIIWLPNESKTVIEALQA